MSLMVGKMMIKNAGRVCNRVYTPLTSSYRTSHYILLPEVPSDTAETNAFMRIENIPPLNEIEPKQVISGFQKLLVNFETDVFNLMERIDSDKAYGKKFEEIFDPIEKSYAPLDFAHKTSRHLAFCYPFSQYHIGFSRVDRKFARVRFERWTNPKLFKALKELESNKHILTEPQKRLVDRVLKSCVRNGLNLSEANQAVCKELNFKVNDYQLQFKETLGKANQEFGLRISDQSSMKDIPLVTKKFVAIDSSNPDKGPWTVNADDKVVRNFMIHCDNRKLRKTLFETYYSRAAKIGGKLLGTNNSEIIKELLVHRKKQAEFFGYKNFAEMQIDNKSAESLENVIDLFEKIKTNVKPVVEEDFKKLESFSAKHGQTDQLEAYDIEFWRNQYTQHHHKVDQDEIARYFPYRKVMDGLFKLSNQLFGVEFRKDDSAKQKLWDPSVEVYNVHDQNGSHLSTLVIDPYLRNRKIDGIWSYSGRDSSQVADFKPLSYLNLNVRYQDSKSVLYFDQLHKLFYEFGSVLQTLLTNTKYTEYSDPNTVELDALEVSNKLFQKLAFVPEVIKLVSAHTNTGESLPVDLLTRLDNSKKSLQSFSLMNQTFLSAFDIESHLSSKFWYDVMKELWPKFMPYKLNKNDLRPCQFLNIFAESYGCNYYSIIWSEMLAADLFEAFNDVGFGNEKKIQEIGGKFRESFLETGSSYQFNENFRKFRGRNPSIDPFIRTFLKP